ncbi:6-hydroxymethylpterin diphosphokinase MptE-like protein [Luteimonas soli]|uniref:6-hydroxymethylpterin diphosphokinase MptE-like protein n=1 Tax=Luteimonas soli TaxID=1648966 RepID=A0ABV7XHY2_9GAMM
MTTPPLLQQRATLNPYLAAAGLLVNRLAWDLRPEAFRSRRRLDRCRDKYAGGRAVVLCNGPSLLETDFELLRQSGVFTFGLNKINLIFDRTTWRPDAIVAVNPYVIEQNSGFYNSTGIPLYLDRCAMRSVPRRDNITYLHSASIRKFARNCRISINQGNTVTFAALQLAYHLGFERVALVGCDHRFTQTGPANLVAVSGARDENHFDPSYFAGGVRWQYPDLVQSEISYLLARDAYEATGRTIVNCTAGGELEVFQRQALADFLSGKESAPEARR